MGLVVALEVDLAEAGADQFQGHLLGVPEIMEIGNTAFYRGSPPMAARIAFRAASFVPRGRSGRSRALDLSCYADTDSAVLVH